MQTKSHKDLSPAIQHMLTHNLSIAGLVKLTMEIRGRVSTPPEYNNEFEYWRLCAVSELMELAEEFPWEHWKQGADQVRWDHARIEAIDVLVFVIAAISSRHFNINDSAMYPTRSLAPAYSGHNHNVNIINNTLSNILSDTLMYQGFSSVAFVNVITGLMELTNTTQEELHMWFVAKCALVYARLHNGTYIDGWEKVSIDGRTESQYLIDQVTYWSDVSQGSYAELFDGITQGSHIFIHNTED